MKSVTPFLFCLAGLSLWACSEATSESMTQRADAAQNSSAEPLPEVITEISFKDAQTKATPQVGFWPHWLGPNYDGISPETNWRSDWSKEPPNVSWRKNVGIGYSSISAANGRIYTMGHKEGNETVYCLNADTGEVIWQQSYPAELIDNLNAGGPGATPTIDGAFLYTNSRDGRLICFEIETGKKVWEKILPKAYDMEIPEWGFTCSPLIRGNRLYVEAGRLVALEKQTGKEIWKSKAYMPGYGTPAAFENEGNRYLAILNNDCLSIAREDDGKEVASFAWPSPFDTNSTTPIIAGKTIFISSGYGKGCALLDFENETLKSRYTNRDLKNHFNNSVLYQGHLYGMDGNSNLGRIVRLTCMDHQTGKVKWREAGFGCGSLLIAAGKLIILSDKGMLVTAEATPEAFKEISRFKVLDHQCWTVPVLSDGRLYCRDSAGNLACVDLRNKPTR
ncbi:PQQ-binding-like beta-propeller repeat protein [Gimesia chilikensis]|uniref:outer membrane protein assembly factor BamB family protein n=1 Tax=Gimesia chilikensis TaxID=2605989 RepID=UPI0011EDB02F|nr:PQQ-binding-like beta-propeller repeat protein [Gimesia chilikensis]KAA0134803.1 PQQ-binding-like beta-propeller repeat protein [Gimesia chilikensis]